MPPETNGQLLRQLVKEMMETNAQLGKLEEASVWQKGAMEALLESDNQQTKDITELKIFRGRVKLVGTLCMTVWAGLISYLSRKGF